MAISSSANVPPDLPGSFTQTAISVAVSSAAMNAETDSALRKLPGLWLSVALPDSIADR